MDNGKAFHLPFMGLLGIIRKRKQKESDIMKKLVLVLLGCLMLSGCGSQNVPGPTVGEDLGTTLVEEEVVTEAPTETAVPEEEKYYLTFTAKDVDGAEVTSDVLANSKLTMLNVWATYCNPCLEEMPYLGEIVAEYDSAEFQILGILSDVSENSSQEDIDYAKELIEQTQANYPHLLLGQDLYNTLVGGVTAVPTTFFVKQDGEVLGYVTGAADKDTWKELINELLAEVEE